MVPLGRGVLCNLEQCGSSVRCFLVSMQEVVVFSLYKFSCCEILHCFLMNSWQSVPGVHSVVMN